MEFWFCVVLTLSLSTNVLGRPEGAPIAACEDFTPQHPSNTPSGDPVPYTVNISNIGDSYMPGENYTIILSGGDVDADFRGFLVQARTMADDTPIGVFVIGSSTDQRNECMDDTGVTHTSRSDKTMVELTWTAPPAGTGDIVFRYAFVDVYATFWANQVTGVIPEFIPSVMFNESTYSVNENAGPVQPVLVISPQLSTDSTVVVYSMDGTATGGDADYTSGPYSVPIPANVTYVRFDIAINDDTMFEDNENFMLIINSSSLESLPDDYIVGDPGQATVTIMDDDTTFVMFNQSMYSVIEDEGPAQPALVLSRSLSSETILKVYNTDGSATGGGVDYTSGPYSVTFPAGMTSASFYIAITNDTIYEPNENFMVTINSTLPNGVRIGSTGQATVTIMNDDARPVEDGATGVAASSVMILLLISIITIAI